MLNVVAFPYLLSIVFLTFPDRLSILSCVTLTDPDCRASFPVIGIDRATDRPATVRAPSPRFVHARSGGRGVPLIERLSNGQISAELDRLPYAEEEAAVSVGQARTCRCGCGQPVPDTRKFVSQDHYSVWLSLERFVGRHRKRM